MPHQCTLCKKSLHEDPGNLPKPPKRTRKHKFQMAPVPPPRPLLGCLPCGCAEIMHKVCLINHFEHGNAKCPGCQTAFQLRQIHNVKIENAAECLFCTELKAVIEAEEKKKTDLQDQLRAYERENKALEVAILKLQGASELLEKNLPWYQRFLYKTP